MGWGAAPVQGYAAGQLRAEAAEPTLVNHAAGQHRCQVSRLELAGGGVLRVLVRPFLQSRPSQVAGSPPSPPTCATSTPYWEESAGQPGFSTVASARLACAEPLAYGWCCPHVCPIMSSSSLCPHPSLPPLPQWPQGSPPPPAQHICRDLQAAPMPPPRPEQGCSVSSLPRREVPRPTQPSLRVSQAEPL